MVKTKKQKRIRTPQRPTKDNWHDQFKVLGEGLDLLREQMKIGFDALIEGSEQLDKRVTRLELKVDNLSTETKAIGAEIRLIRQELHQKVSREEFESLEERIERLERALGTQV